LPFSTADDSLVRGASLGTANAVYFENNVWTFYLPRHIQGVNANYGR
jgi:hypothetical protein